MVVIAVISDTHWERWNPADSLTRALVRELAQGFDQIWHGGDVVEAAVLTELQKFAPLVCVRGNCDGAIRKKLPHAVSRTVEEVQVGMIHGWDLPLDHCKTVVDTFSNDVDIIIHGHTHLRRYLEWSRADGSKVTLLNPGSVSSPRGGEPPGFGVLTIEGSSWTYQTRDLC